jgi:hypothetical protein
MPESEYGDLYRSHYLTLFQDFVASADTVSSRRHTTNSFFLPINTSLVSLIGYVSSEENNLAWVVALAGVIFSLTWIALIDSYRSLNAAKFKVIGKLEKRLPFAAYDAEWKFANSKEKGKKHVAFNKLESIVPKVFAFVHSVVFVLNVFPWILDNYFS